MTAAGDIAEAFLDALERLDAEAAGVLLTEDAVEVLPFAPSGGPGPAASFEGRDEVLRVQRTIVGAFSSVAFADRRVTTADDGTAVFVEARGERVQRDSGRIYRNGYVLRFDLRDGLIARITEYSNPVAFATFFGVPIG